MKNFSASDNGFLPGYEGGRSKASHCQPMISPPEATAKPQEFYDFYVKLFNEHLKLADRHRSQKSCISYHTGEARTAASQATTLAAKDSTIKPDPKFSAHALKFFEAVRASEGPQKNLEALATSARIKHGAKTPTQKNWS